MTVKGGTTIANGLVVPKPLLTVASPAVRTEWEDGEVRWHIATSLAGPRHSPRVNNPVRRTGEVGGTATWGIGIEGIIEKRERQ